MLCPRIRGVLGRATIDCLEYRTNEIRRGRSSENDDFVWKNFWNPADFGTDDKETNGHNE
jgi:hypothetical protein